MALSISVWAARKGLIAGVAAGAMTAVPAQAQDSASVQEIVVTAQKREQRLNEVPASVTAVGGERLTELGASNLEEISALVPGLQFQSGGQGGGTIALRGISTGREPSQLVGVLVDGVPYGSSGSFALAGISQLDAAGWDLDRLEVLRGPQGTLYGAGAFGGLLSYVYRAPSLTTPDLRLEAEASATEDGGVNHALRAAGNAVLVENVLATRGSVSFESNTGWADDRLSGQDDVNDNELLNARGAVLWRPNERLGLRLNGIHQKSERTDNDVALYDVATGRPSAGELEQSRPLREPVDLEQNQVSLTADYDFGGATLTSITSYAETTLLGVNDFSANPIRLAFAASPVAPLIGAVRVQADVEVEKTVQELRLASNGDGAFRWLVGAFYTDETVGNFQQIGAKFATGDGIPGLDPFVTFQLDSTFEERAAFANLEYDLNDRVQLSGGLRWSENEQTFQQANAGVLVGPGGLPAGGAGSSKEDRVDYSATLRFRVDADDYAYLRAASGYRAGGPNVALPGLPPTFAADEIQSWEGGYKARFLGGRASADAALFYIDWTDIQLNANVGGISGRANGGGASSRGLELGFDVRATESLTVGGSLALTDSQLDDDAPAVGGRAGERLPNAPEVSAALTADYRFPLFGREGFAGGVLRYVSDRNSAFSADPTTPNFVMDSYTLTDARAGVEFGSWRVTGFVRNVFDERAELSAATANYLLTGQAQVTVARPRTVGLTISADF